MTDAQFQSWLLNPTSIRLVLVEAIANISGTETVIYMANGTYVTGAADAPANTVYDAIIKGGVAITENLGVSAEGKGSASMNTGDVEITNPNGERDAWLGSTYTWAQRNIVAYIGDPRWPRSDFRIIFSGVTADITSRSREVLNLVMSDKLQRLNVATTDLKLGGTSTNKDAVLPLTFGEVHNITPLLSNPATLEYQVHNGPIEAIIEVRDNGVPLLGTSAPVVTPSTGKFTLPTNPVGTITASVQGYKPSTTYYHTIAATIQQIVLNYGQSARMFTSADLDTANISAFETAHPQEIGTHLQSGENLFSTIQEIADSVGAQVVMSRTGLLQLIQLASPASSTITIGPDDMLENSLAISMRTTVIAAKVLGYCKNWTVQPNLQTGIAPEGVTLFGSEYLTVTQSDATVKAAYRLTAMPAEEDTLLLTAADATNEAARRLNLYKVPRTVYTFTGMPQLLTLTLGQAVTLKSYRYGLFGGVLGMVVSLQPDWITGRVTVGVFV